MDLHLDLEAVAGHSKRARLESGLRDAVRAGRLAPGTRLPATRSLCAQLGVSRGVVVEAYAQLAAEGYLQTRRGGGTTVAPLAAAPAGRPARERPASPPRYDLNPFTPAVAEFPRGPWAAALGQVLRSVGADRLGLPDPAGMPELRAALASYLARVRGVLADPDRILITSGTRHSMGLVWATLAKQGVAEVAVEQPGWPGAAETAHEAGLLTRGVRVDDDGLVVAQLAESSGAVAVAPAHQYPTGAVLSPARRRELIAWAGRSTRVIVEDDYDAEYRYDRQPIGCVQGLAPDHVAYAGSTSKTLSPALRIGWLVMPERLSGPVLETARRRGGAPSPILQLALAHILERGDLDRHLRRQRRRYHQRRAALLDALATRLPALRVSGVSAGLFVLLELPDGVSEMAVAGEAAAEGIALGAPVADRDRGALALGYANLAPAAASRAIDALAEIIERCPRG
jgi:GntR family transcriptional regulator/MocR family aminotransferase